MKKPIHNINQTSNGYNEWDNKQDYVFPYWQSVRIINLHQKICRINNNCPSTEK